MSHLGFAVEYGAARPDEYNQVRDLWAAVFGPDGGAYHRALLEADPWRREAYCQVARAGGRVVSVVCLCRRPMRYQGETLYLGRIEAVATLPKLRRRGLSTELLRRTVAVMEAEDFAFSSLNTGNHSHYARHDFYRVPLPKYLLTLNAKAAAPEADPGVELLTPERWLAEAPPVYAAYNGTLPLHFERSPEYWRRWIGLRLSGAPREDLLLPGLRREGALVGYLLGEMPREGERRVHIHEAAALEPEGIARLLTEAARAARLEGAGELFVNVPHSESVRRALERLGALKVGQGGVMHRRIHAAEAVMREIDRSYESGAAYWWNLADGY